MDISAILHARNIIQTAPEAKRLPYRVNEAFHFQLHGTGFPSRVWMPSSEGQAKEPNFS